MESIRSNKLPNDRFLLSCRSYLEHSPCRSCGEALSLQASRDTLCGLRMVLDGLRSCFAYMGIHFSASVFRFLQRSRFDFPFCFSCDGTYVSSGVMNSTPSPNHALQRTRLAVTPPASTAAFPPAMQASRLHGASLSLGSLGVATRTMLRTLLIFLFAVSAFGSEPAKESPVKLLESRIKEEGEVVFIPWNGKLPKDGSNCYFRLKQESQVHLAYMGYGGDLCSGHFSFTPAGSIEAKLSFIYWPIMVLRRDGEDLLLYREDGKTWWHDLYPPAGKPSERDTWPFRPKYIDNFWPLRAAKKKNRAEQGGNPK